MRSRNKNINSKALSEHTRRIFSISQPFPAQVTALLHQKRKRDLTQKQQKQIYDHIKEKGVFPVLTSPKSIIDFCLALNIDYYKAGQLIPETEDCFVILDGAVKIFQESAKAHHQTSINQSLRLSLSSGILSEAESHKIQKQKLTIGEVVLFDKEASNLIYIASSSSTLLRIPFEMHSVISFTNYMVEVKKKQQFFSRISLFERHYRSSLEDFVSCLEQISCSFGKTIFREGAEIKNIFIIKEGEFILQKNVSTDDLIKKQGKLVTSFQAHTSEDEVENEIKHVQKHYRACPFKLIGIKEMLGDCEYILNNKTYIYTMRCHKEGSKLYSINAQTFFKKLLVSENSLERVNSILMNNFEAKKKQIEAGVKFNKSNTLILKFMPNSTIRHKTHHNETSKQKNNWSTISENTKNPHNSTQRSCSFFERMNKTIINQNKGQIRKRNESRNLDNQAVKNSKKIYKTPAVVQQVVQIVNQKKAYHRLRNMGIEKKYAFEFDMNNVPPFIKKKYGHSFSRKKSQ